MIEEEIMFPKTRNIQLLLIGPLFALGCLFYLFNVMTIPTAVAREAELPYPQRDTPPDPEPTEPDLPHPARRRVRSGQSGA